MHAAQIESIDDIETLRRFAIESLEAIASKEAESAQVIASQRALIADRDAKLAASDRTIAYKTKENDALKLEIGKRPPTTPCTPCERLISGQEPTCAAAACRCRGPWWWAGV